jgi:hypothetical protein
MYGNNLDYLDNLFTYIAQRKKTPMHCPQIESAKSKFSGAT